MRHDGSAKGARRRRWKTTHDRLGQRGTPRSASPLRRARFFGYLACVVVMTITGCPIALQQAGAANATACGGCLPTNPLPRIERIVSGNGRTTLCPISKITPADQGGTSNIEIFTYSTTRACDHRSTAHQGAIYLVLTETAADAQYLLDLANVTSSFVAGWQTGKVAILLGAGTAPIHNFETDLALRGHARRAFFHR